MSRGKDLDDFISFNEKKTKIAVLLTLPHNMRPLECSNSRSKQPGEKAFAQIITDLA